MSQALCDFFGCLRLPFDKSVPLRDLFPSTAHQEVQARLAFALTQRYPAMITGDVGSGKSTAVRAFIQSLDTNLHLVARVACPTPISPSRPPSSSGAGLLRPTPIRLPRQCHLSPPWPGRTLARHPGRPLPTRLSPLGRRR